MLRERRYTKNKAGLKSAVIMLMESDLRRREEPDFMLLRLNSQTNPPEILD